MIHIDFDGTLASVHALGSAYTMFIPFPEKGSIAERFAARREEMAPYDALDRAGQIKFWLDRGAVVQEDRDGYTVVGFARPHAHDFILACVEMDPDTSILTSGRWSWQNKLARRLGFPGVELYGRENYHELKAHPFNLLVDDLGPTTTGVQEKMKALGFRPKKVPSIGASGQFNLVYPTERHIQVSPWSKEADDRELLDILPRIKALLP